MGKIYFPLKRNSTDDNPIRMLEEWINGGRDYDIQARLNMKIIKDATRENKCPMYDGRGDCGLYPVLQPCHSEGKLTDNRCSFHGMTLDGLMETLKKNVQEYGEKRLK